jgi:CheY-like chemotaxis protein
MARTIAIINDDTVFLDLMHDLLSEEGYTVKPFREAHSAYEGVRELKPDLIVLDIRMESPATGWQILELIKLDPILTATPVVVCSADIVALQERAAHLQSKGCTILPKPFDLDDLLAIVERHVGPRPRGAQEAEAE